MDFLSRINGKFIKLKMQINTRNRPDAFFAETKDIEELIEQESLRLSGIPIPYPPSKAVTDLIQTDIPEIFGLTEVASSELHLQLNANDCRISSPNFLDVVLDDYRLATEGSPQNEVNSRASIDAIILLTLAMTKKRMAEDSRMSVDSMNSVRSIHLQFEKELSLPWTIKHEPFQITGHMDCSMWYGSPGSLETNCIMIEAKRALDSEKAVPQCLACMALVHLSRKKAKVADQDIWGIATDSHTWFFIRLNSKSQYAVTMYRWISQKEAVLSMIYKICQITVKAAASRPSSNRWSTDTGLMID